MWNAEPVVCIHTLYGSFDIVMKVGDLHMDFGWTQAQCVPDRQQSYNPQCPCIIAASQDHSSMLKKNISSTVICVPKCFAAKMIIKTFVCVKAEVQDQVYDKVWT